MRYGFRNIRNKAHQASQTNTRQLKDNRELIRNLSMTLLHKHMKLRFDQFQINCRNQHQKYASLKAIMQRPIQRFHRDYFNKWRKTASMLEVIRFNNEEGPVMIEVAKKHAEILALKFMIEDKMLLDEKQIAEVLD